jgi:hypothetical protein
MCVEFRLRTSRTLRQERHSVIYKGEVVGEYVPDLVVHNSIVVDTRRWSGSPTTNVGRCSTTCASRARSRSHLKLNTRGLNGSGLC